MEFGQRTLRELPSAPNHKLRQKKKEKKRKNNSNDITFVAELLRGYEEHYLIDT